MDRMLESGLVLLAVLGFVGWLGGGRKWAFRTMLSVLMLMAVGAAGIFLYGYVTDRSAERRTQKIHDCAVAKVADPHCEPAPKDSDFPEGAIVCPIYTLSDSATPEQGETAITAAENECAGEMNPSQKSLHEQIIQYRREHGIKEEAKRQLTAKACAAKVRSFYPRVYDDLDDATLTKKVLARYPSYCDAVSTPPYFVPEIQGIR
jgi:hypothetical protein